MGDSIYHFQFSNFDFRFGITDYLVAPVRDKRHWIPVCTGTSGVKHFKLGDCSGRMVIGNW